MTMTIQVWTAVSGMHFRPTRRKTICNVRYTVGRGYYTVHMYSNNKAIHFIDDGRV